MKLSTKTRYGARAMLYLALNNDAGPCSVREIAAHQGLSPKYLEHLMAELGTAGLVRGVRGPNGGYTLGRPPAKITLRDIYDAFEGIGSFVECTEDPSLCPRYDGCVTQEVWSQMYLACMGVLESATLTDLVQRAQEKQGSLAAMYYI